jgi:hypothetical protein
MRAFALSALGVAISIALPHQMASSQTTTDRSIAPPIKAVVELFTSQGCSSCPRADALMDSTFSKRPDVLALSFAVDYWDYIGWKDTNGSPRNSARQREYARTRGDGAVYTPQMVINGLTHVVGSQGPEIERAINKASSTAASDWVQMTVKAGPNGHVIDVPTSSAGRTQTAQLYLVGVKRRQSVKIERGENAGRSITYTNVVRELIPLGTWTGAPMSLTIPEQRLALTTCDAFAVILQRGAGGPMIGAATVTGW